jgi:uncharacterized damage-inducible protein DinB
MNKEQAIKKITASRQEFLDALSGLPINAYTQEAVEGVWNVKDLIAHIETWERACLIPLREYARGGKFTPEKIPDHDAWNLRNAQIWKSKPLEMILEEYRSTREELLALVESLPAELWTRQLNLPWGECASLAEMLSGLAWHEDEHRRPIQEWRARGEH